MFILKCFFFFIYIIKLMFNYFIIYIFIKCSKGILVFFLVYDLFVMVKKVFLVCLEK